MGLFLSPPLFVPAPTKPLSRRFFGNKGEVAGVFTVVGLIAVAILFTAVTTVIRRRRAQQFDKDVAEAAMQAAATSHSANFDDYDNPYNGYSAESHGTYGQPAMSHGGGGHPAESYVMNDVGGGYDHYGGVAAGAAGIGAASPMQRAKSRRQISGSNYIPGDGSAGGGQPGDYGPGGYEERTPYAAFAGPGVQPHEVYDPSGGVPGLRYRHTPGGQEPDLLDAAGLGVAAAAPAYISRQSSSARNTPPQPPHADLSRSKSKGSFGPISESLGYHSSSSPPPPSESYAAHYQPGYHPESSQSQPQQFQAIYGNRPSGAFSDGHEKDINRLSADPFASHHTMPSPPTSTSHAQYDAYADDAMGHGPGSDDAGGHFVGDTGRSEEGGARMSFQDEEDYGRQPRVLKVNIKSPSAL
jgi:hypothetical protein